MRTDLVREAEFIVSSARLKELQECSALLRRTRLRAEEIVNQARALHVEAVIDGEPSRVDACASQLEEAHAAYCRIVNAYLSICRRINDERLAILKGCQGQPDGLVSGHA
ncbi:hypothetical protein [Nonomuraea sp. NPDC050310]|uniref:hypothetical protein n=1 Tax=unclassified Nonomuraea TaxID=2593643 RepID=UPI0033D66A6D